jgi:hypothetical protein
MPIVWKSGSRNILEPYGPLQACNGIALPYFLKDLDEICYKKNWHTLSISKYERDEVGVEEVMLHT